MKRKECLKGVTQGLAKAQLVMVTPGLLAAAYGFFMGTLILLEGEVVEVALGLGLYAIILPGLWLYVRYWRITLGEPAAGYELRTWVGTFVYNLPFAVAAVFALVNLVDKSYVLDWTDYIAIYAMLTPWAAIIFAVQGWRRIRAVRRGLLQGAEGGLERGVEGPALVKDL